MLYAIGDIHGESERLSELLEVLPLGADDELVFLGDYVDRGPDSRGVIEILLELAKKVPCTFLLGNHESMLLDFLGWTDRRYMGGEAFLANGGERTLASYGYRESLRKARRRVRLPKTHEDFLLGLRLHYHVGDYLFVHAGVGTSRSSELDAGEAVMQSSAREVLWNRITGHVEHGLGVTVVYGHTAQEDFQVCWNLPYSIGIDTGVVYGGPLTAIRLPDETVFQV